MRSTPRHAAWRIARIAKRQEPASLADLALFAATMAEAHAQDLMIKAISRGAANAKRNGR